MDHGVDRLGVYVDFSEKDDEYIIVSRKNPDGTRKIINKFEFDCAKDLYSILIGE